MSWEENLVEDPQRIREIVQGAKRVAVLGMEREENSDRPAWFVPDYLRQHGYEIVPLPVKYPGTGEIAGMQAYHSLAEVPGEIDVVDVFRLPRDIARHVDDLIAKKPKAVWFQSGIRNDRAAEKLAQAGIQVVQDRCMKVEHTRLARSGR